MRPHPRPSRRLLQIAALLHAPLDRPVPPITTPGKADADQPDLDLADAKPVERKDDTIPQT